MPSASASTPLLLIADSAETCERMASALLSAPVFYRIERMTSHDLIQSGPPADIGLALVDQVLQVGKQAQIVQKLTAAGLVVVAMVDSHDVAALQEVVLAGAGALLAMPFVDTQLWETVAAAQARVQHAARGESARSAARRPATSSAGLAVAIHGPKGGTGTSLVAVNLAVSLQERALRGAVLVEVAEGPGTLAVLLNMRAERSMGDLLARFDPTDTELLAGVCMKHASGLRVLLAPPTPGVRVGADFLEDIITLLQQLYDFVVVDLGASARANVIPIMRKVHAALVVVVPEMTALHHGRLFIEQAESAMPDLRLNIILNRAGMPSGVPAEAIRRHLKMQTASEIPDEPDVVTASVNRGVPVVMSNPRSGVTRAIQKLARDLAPGEGERAADRNPLPSLGALGRLALGGRRG